MCVLNAVCMLAWPACAGKGPKVELVLRLEISKVPGDPRCVRRAHPWGVPVHACAIVLPALHGPRACRPATCTMATTFES